MTDLHVLTGLEMGDSQLPVFGLLSVLLRPENRRMFVLHLRWMKYEELLVGFLEEDFVRGNEEVLDAIRLESNSTAGSVFYQDNGCESQQRGTDFTHEIRT